MSLCTAPPAIVPRSMWGKNKETARIVIIGAGASGIAAATRLLEQGFRNVRILEAEDRIGGRIHTIPFADNAIDLGAQWCHGEQGNVVYERVKELDLLDRTGNPTMHFFRSNKETLGEDQAKALKNFMDASSTLTDADYEGSVGDYLTQKYWKEFPTMDRVVAKEILDCIKKMICSSDACDHLFELSPQNHLTFAESEGDPNLNWRGKGYKQFLRVLMNVQDDDPEDLGVLKGHVLFNKRIAEINWEGADELMIRCWNGEILTADHVICTVSLGVLKEQHRNLFVPNLPAAKVRAIDGLKLGTVDKFLLEFSEQPMPESLLSFNFLWLEADLLELRGTENFWLEGICGFHRVGHQPRLIEGWIIGAHARHMETLTEEKVLLGLLWLFRKFLSFDVPHPKRFLRSQWHSHPNFRGSYSFQPTYADELRTGRWDLESPLADVSGRPRLQFAGEASSRTHFSTVHGAVETGWREADRLNEFYKVRA
ncbi:spermine oxidase [Drosophila pseudoobscura]|uniref:Spermine oxidase n=1 Tax=Drosophila pseudoobscura pseudoobscura TaxID=46245 RepID=A0A6I8UCV2_DROPS|nr:spermine oxidase [Drosophila pseudoobscura]